MAKLSFSVSLHHKPNVSDFEQICAGRWSDLKACAAHSALYLCISLPRVNISYHDNSRFSHDVTTAMLVPLNKEKAAMLVPRPNPPGIELYYYANASFCFR